MASTPIVKPQPGDEVTATWGQTVADAHNGIQHGTVAVPINAAVSGSAPITFPRPYATVPQVLVTTTGTVNYVASLGSATTTGAVINAFRKDATSGTANVTCQWIAIGTPA